MNTWIRMTLLALAVLLSTMETATAQTLKERIQAVRDQQRAQTPKKVPPTIKVLQSLAYTKLTVDFDETPTRDVIDYLRTALGVNLVARYSDDAAGHGIDPDVPITLAVEDLRAVDVLDLVLDQCSTVEPCTWQVRSGFLEVGTKERLSEASARELGVYPIDELLFEPPDFDDAPPMGLSSPGYQNPGGYIGRNAGGNYLNPYGTGTTRRGIGHSGSGVIGTTMRSGGGGTNSDADRRERALELVDLITMVIEPDAWAQNGGTQATITYRSGALIVHAPDFVQRQIGGYPRVPPPAAKPGASAAPADPGRAAPGTP